MSNVVAINGCFDILHIGHIRLLKFAKSLAGQYGKVVVGINSDSSVKTLKGPIRPINKQEYRKEFLEAISFVDKVYIFQEINAVKFLNEVMPDIWIKGSSYNIDNINKEEMEIIKKHNIKIRFFDFVDEFSTTNIISKLNS